MSIERCDSHGRWDSDLYEECPICLIIASNADPVKHPFGYAVINDQGYFVGIWRDEQIAIDICKKGNPAHNQKVVQVYAAPSPPSPAKDGMSEREKLLFDLVNAVEVKNDIICNDVNGKNWFDLRDEALAAYEGKEEVR